MTIDFKPNLKQHLAWNKLNDKTTNEVLFGGGAGSGKSFLGCYWLSTNCLQYPETRWLMGRSVLKSLKESTLNTFFDVMKQWGFESGKQFKYNAIDGIISFYTGSKIYLKDLAYYPSDPNYDSLGSTEFTGGFLDECNQMTEKAKNIVASRLRYKLDDYNLIPKLLMTCNPAKNWVYSEFYKKDRENTLEPYKAFVQALVTDNPNISPHYIENLKKLDNASRERLLYGNWDYDSDPSKLIEYDKILNLWTNSFIESGEMFMSCDIAMQGSDKFVIMVWSGFRIIEIYSEDKSDAKHIEDIIKSKAEFHRVPQSNIVYDADGLGSYLRGYLENAQPFVNNSKALNDENYQNLKTQAYFKLAEKINHDEIFINWTDQIVKELLIEELDTVKQYNADKDGKLSILPKEKVKEILSRSPDYADAMAYRMFFDFKPNQDFSSLYGY